MNRERNQSADVQHATVSPNEAMDSYIGDLLCSGSEFEFETVPESTAVSESIDKSKAGTISKLESSIDLLPNKQTSTDSLLSISNNIKPGFSLIPLISLDRYRLDLSHPQRSLSASFILLLWGVHLLRMPIAGRLRSSVSEHCRQRLMEYRLLTEITQLPTAGGTSHE